jgi:hypothetical protein
MSKDSDANNNFNVTLILRLNSTHLPLNTASSDRVSDYLDVLLLG